MRRQIASCSVALFAALSIQLAHANCGSIITVDYASALAAQDPILASQVIEESPECFSGGATTYLSQINGSMFQQALAISDILRQRRLADGPTAQVAGLTGAAAGATYGGWNTWGNISFNRFEHTYNVANSTGPSANDIHFLNGIAGSDLAFSPASVVGVSLSYARGTGSGRKEDPNFDVNSIDSEAFTLAPYASWQLNRDWAFDASAGYGQNTVDVFTTNTVDADRWFAAANLSYSRWFGNCQLNGRASLLHGVEDYENIRVSGVTQPGTSAKNTLDQTQFGVQSGYWWHGIMPYAELKYSLDIRRNTTQFGSPADPIGKEAWVWGIGANIYSLGKSMTGGIGFSQEEGRSKQESNLLTANINLRF